MRYAIPKGHYTDLLDLLEAHLLDDEESWEETLERYWGDAEQLSSFIRSLSELTVSTLASFLAAEQVWAKHLEKGAERWIGDTFASAEQHLRDRPEAVGGLFSWIELQHRMAKSGLFE